MTQVPPLCLENSLQVFFFDQLCEANKKTLRPLPNEILYYSSLVMDQLGTSQRYFENVDGKIREKILGIKLLESSQLTREKQKSATRDIAETALVLCGFFPDSMNKKIIDTRYYHQIGMLAYRRLNGLVPRAYDVPDFFQKMSRHFQQVTMLMGLIAEHSAHDASSIFLITPEKKAV